MSDLSNNLSSVSWSRPYWSAVVDSVVSTPSSCKAIILTSNHNLNTRVSQGFATLKPSRNTKSFFWHLLMNTCKVKVFWEGH